MRKLLLLSLLVSTSTNIAFADGKASNNSESNKIMFTGNFTDSTCSVDINGNDLNVDLGNWSTKNYKEPGQYTDFKPLNITLTDCPKTNYKNANFQFKGTPATGNPDLFAINNESTVNVGIGLYEEQDTGKKIIPNTRTLFVPIDPKEGTGKITIYANYVALGATGEGNADGNINFDISYD